MKNKNHNTNNVKIFDVGSYLVNQGVMSKEMWNKSRDIDLERMKIEAEMNKLDDRRAQLYDSWLALTKELKGFSQLDKN